MAELVLQDKDASMSIVYFDIEDTPYSDIKIMLEHEDDIYVRKFKITPTQAKELANFILENYKD